MNTPMETLGPGIYLDADDVHFNFREMCEDLGIPHTHANCQMIRHETLRAFVEVFGRPPKEVIVINLPAAGGVS